MGRKKRGEPDQEMVVTAWTEWLDTVPAEDRLAVGAIIRSCDISTKAGLNAFLLGILAAFFEGKIHPAVLASAKPWAELLMTNIYVMSAANGTPELAGPTAGSALLEMRNLVRERVKAVEPVYTIEADEVEIDNIIDAEFTR